MFIHINILCDIRGKIKIQIFSLAPDDNAHLYGHIGYVSRHSFRVWPAPPQTATLHLLSVCVPTALRIAAMPGNFAQYATNSEKYLQFVIYGFLLYMCGNIIMSCYLKADNPIYFYRLAWWLLIFHETSGSRNYTLRRYMYIYIGDLICINFYFFCSLLIDPNIWKIMFDSNRCGNRESHQDNIRSSISY